MLMTSLYLDYLLITFMTRPPGGWGFDTGIWEGCSSIPNSLGHRMHPGAKHHDIIASPKRVKSTL